MDDLCRWPGSTFSYNARTPIAYGALGYFLVLQRLWTLIWISFSQSSGGFI